MSIPVVIVTALNTYVYVRLNRKLSKLKIKHLRLVTNFVNFCRVKSEELLRLHKFEALMDRFHCSNKLSILLSAN